jgi:hypothetical protein
MGGFVMIGEEEREIVESWIWHDGLVTADENCKRIERLIAEHLERVGSSEDGWTTYFVDPSGGRWKLIYPHGHLHGGGPPTLCRHEA